MRVADFHFELPDALIARYPLAERRASRLLVLDGPSGSLAHRQFADILQYLRPGDLMVFNNTRVIPARLFGQKASGGKVEVLVEPKNIAELMRSADLAICAGGTTTFELVSQGLPFLSVAMADNQVELCHAWHARGVCIHMGLGRSLNQEAFLAHWEKIQPVAMRQAMRESGRGLADNQGAQRIREAVEKCL